MKITAILPQRLHPERVNVHVDGEFRLGLAAELVLAEPLRVGAPRWSRQASEPYGFPCCAQVLRIKHQSAQAVQEGRT
jgi:hypothetical protein